MVVASVQNSGVKAVQEVSCLSSNPILRQPGGDASIDTVKTVPSDRLLRLFKIQEI